MKKAMNIQETNDVLSRILNIAKNPSESGHVLHLGGQGKVFDPKSLQVENTNNIVDEILGSTNLEESYWKTPKNLKQKKLSKSPARRSKVRRAHESIARAKAALGEQIEQLLRLSLTVAESGKNTKNDRIALTIANDIAPKVESLLARLEGAEELLGQGDEVSPEGEEHDEPESEEGEEGDGKESGLNLADLLTKSDASLDQIAAQVSALADKADGDLAKELDALADKLQNDVGPKVDQAMELLGIGKEDKSDEDKKDDEDGVDYQGSGEDAGGDDSDDTGPGPLNHGMESKRRPKGRRLSEETAGDALDDACRLLLKVKAILQDDSRLDDSKEEFKKAVEDSARDVLKVLSKLQSLNSDKSNGDMK